MNHPEITTGDISAVLERNMLAGNRKPPLFLGIYGVGKSTQLAKFAADNGFHYIDYRAGHGNGSGNGDGYGDGNGNGYGYGSGEG